MIKLDRYKITLSIDLACSWFLNLAHGRINTLSNIAVKNSLLVSFLPLPPCLGMREESTWFYVFYFTVSTGCFHSIKVKYVWWCRTDPEGRGAMQTHPGTRTPSVLPCCDGVLVSWCFIEEDLELELLVGVGWVENAPISQICRLSSLTWGFARIPCHPRCFSGTWCDGRGSRVQ